MIPRTKLRSRPRQRERFDWSSPHLRLGPADRAKRTGHSGRRAGVHRRTRNRPSTSPPRWLFWARSSSGAGCLPVNLGYAPGVGGDSASCGRVSRGWNCAPKTPSLAKEGVATAPVRATENGALQEPSELVVAIGCDEHNMRWVARRRACPQVPASPKMYPSRTRDASGFRRSRQHKMPVCRAFLEAL
jgi:hypothetical protein